MKKGISFLSSQRPAIEKIDDIYWFYQSTAQMSVKQFQSFLREIEQGCADQGFYLPNASDLY